MKKLIPAILFLILITGLYSCSNKPKEFYTQFGYRGPVKSIIEYSYDSVVNRFGEWVPYDTSIQYYSKKYFDSAGNQVQQDYYYRFTKDVLGIRYTTLSKGNKSISTTCYDVDGVQVERSIYTYTSDSAFSTSTYDSSGNLSSKTNTRFDPATRKYLGYDFYTYQHDSLTGHIQTDYKWDGDTIFSTTKLLFYKDSIHTTREVALSRDKFGNIIKSILIDQQQKPRVMYIKVYEYYGDK